MGLITDDKFQQAFPHAKSPIAWAMALDREGERVGLTTGRRVAHFLAQLSHESGGFRIFEENLNYRTPSRLDAIFAAVHGQADAAALIARGPRAIANRVYANRNGNGGEASGDGWRFRGMGAIQLTGRANYAKASGWTGLDLIADPEQVKAPGPGAKAAADYWRVCGLNDEADGDDVTAITHAINPALAGLEARKSEYQRLRAIWAG
jgi:putative chitinase